MTNLENNLSIYKNKNSCQLKIGNDLFTLAKGKDYGDREVYSYKSERGIGYRIFWLKNDRRFANLFIDESTIYQGSGIKEVAIPKDKQFVNDF